MARKKNNQERYIDPTWTIEGIKYRMKEALGKCADEHLIEKGATNLYWKYLYD